MQLGDLVRITRASIGIPKDSIGLIVRTREHDATDADADPVYTLWHIQLITKTKLNGTVRRYLTQDLRKLK